jgi:malate dehydrogenase (oxaloacetate-decarboxylating)(NADP+)
MDINGVVHVGREDLEADPASYLHEVASTTDKRTFGDVFQDADVFLGLSAGNLLKPE